MQLAHFIAARGVVVVRQVACSHALDGAQGLTQRDHNLACDAPRRDGAQQQRQHGAAEQQVFRMLAVEITLGGLHARKLFAQIDQRIAQAVHALQYLGVGHLSVSKAGHGGTVVLQRFAGLLQVGGVLDWQGASQAGGVLDGVVDGVQRRLLGFRFAAVGVATHLETGLLQQFAQFDHAVELRHAVALQQGFFDVRHLGHRVIGGRPQLGTAVFAGLGGLCYFSHGPAIIGHSRQLLLHQRDICRLCELAPGRFQRLVQLGQAGIELSGSVFASVLFIVQARDTQVFGQGDDFGDIRQFVAAIDHGHQAVPAGSGNQQGQ